MISGAVGTGYQPVFKVEHSLPRKSGLCSIVFIFV